MPYNTIPSNTILYNATTKTQGADEGEPNGNDDDDHRDDDGKHEDADDEGNRDTDVDENDTKHD